MFFKFDITKGYLKYDLFINYMVIRLITVAVRFVLFLFLQLLLYIPSIACL